MHNQDVVILIAEDDDGHARLIEKNLRRSGITNKIIRFSDGLKVLSYLFREGDEPHRPLQKPLLLLLDIRMPNLDGIEVLKRLKSDQMLKKMPVIMLTTTDDPRDIEECHSLGCNTYIVKPLDHDRFMQAIQKVGLFVQIVSLPEIKWRAGIIEVNCRGRTEKLMQSLNEHKIN